MKHIFHRDIHYTDTCRHSIQRIHCQSIVSFSFWQFIIYSSQETLYAQLLVSQINLRNFFSIFTNKTSVSFVFCRFFFNINMDFSFDATAFGSNWMNNNAVIIASGGGITGDSERPSCACCSDHDGQTRSPKKKKFFLDPLFIYCLLIAFIICKFNSFRFFLCNILFCSKNPNFFRLFFQA